jgi:tetratricopeptide (TPR) repeat protein
MPEKAITIFEALLKQQPDNPSVILNMGHAYQDACLIERAVECFQQVIAMSAPDTPYAQKARQALSEIRNTV